jgi:hypothetical protein
MPPGFIRDLVERITPSVLTAKRNEQDDVNDMVVEHVKQTSAAPGDSSRVISDAIDDGRVAVIGLSYKPRGRPRGPRFRDRQALGRRAPAAAPEHVALPSRVFCAAPDRPKLAP